MHRASHKLSAEDSESSKLAARAGTGSTRPALPGVVAENRNVAICVSAMMAGAHWTALVSSAGHVCCVISLEYKRRLFAANNAAEPNVRALRREYITALSNSGNKDQYQHYFLFLLARRRSCY